MRVIATVVSGALGCAPAAVPAQAGAFAAAPEQNVVATWNAETVAVLKEAATQNLLQSRVLALVHAAVYEAVNSIDGGHEPYVAALPAWDGASVDAAAAAAARTVLVRLYPAQAERIDATYAASLAAVPDGVAEAEGARVGIAAAHVILMLRHGDGADRTGTYTPRSGPGYWRPTLPAHAPATLPAFRDVEPWTLYTADQFRPGPPPRLAGRAYARDFAEVKALGAATGSARTAEQTEIANFWYEASQVGWNRIARVVSTAKGSGTVTSARLFALLNMAGMDAYVAGWDAKYAYGFWRPVTAIREAGADGNDATRADPAWSSLLVTPAHPDYVSTHSVWSGAASTVLAAFYGDRVRFSVSGDSAPGVTRSFPGFRAASHENVLSRIYAGVHFRTANVTGERLGRKIARHALRTQLGPDG